MVSRQYNLRSEPRLQIPAECSDNNANKGGKRTENGKNRRLWRIKIKIFIWNFWHISAAALQTSRLFNSRNLIKNLNFWWCVWKISSTRKLQNQSHQKLNNYLIMSIVNCLYKRQFKHWLDTAERNNLILTCNCYFRTHSLNKNCASNCLVNKSQ